MERTISFLELLVPDGFLGQSLPHCLGSLKWQGGRGGRGVLDGEVRRHGSGGLDPGC